MYKAIRNWGFEYNGVVVFCDCLASQTPTKNIGMRVKNKTFNPRFMSINTVIMMKANGPNIARIVNMLGYLRNIFIYSGNPR